MRKNRSALLSFAAIIGMGWGAHVVQTSVDDGRRARLEENRMIFLPSPKAMKVATLGYSAIVSDLYWIRSVLLFVDFLENENPENGVWLYTVLKTVGTLDPRWRTPYFYGGGMLRLVAYIDGSDEIYVDGMTAFPNDAHFPFSIAMNAYLFRKDLDKAVKYLNIAAAKPDAPRWYRSAAAEFIHRGGQRRTAIEYLRRQLESANSDRERQVLDSKIRSLLYEEISAAVSERQGAWEARFGQPLHSVEALGDLPPDPLGGEWILAVDGVVRSDINEPIVAYQAKLDERAILIFP